MSFSFTKERKLLIQILLQLCVLAKKAHGHVQSEEVLLKADQTPVTLYDFYFQAAINRAITDQFASDAIVGEENSCELYLPHNRAFKERLLHFATTQKLKNSASELLETIDLAKSQGKENRFWVLDPIDGTRGFILGREYALAIALVQEGQIVLGALCCPHLKCSGEDREGYLLIAEKNKGCVAYALDESIGEGIALKIQSSIADPLIYLEPPSETRHHSHEKALKLVHKISSHPRVLEMDSQCKYAAVALGMAPLYLRVPHLESYKEKIWDHAAGTLIVEEAGGKVSDIFGKKLDFTSGPEMTRNTGIVAATAEIHNRLFRPLA